MYDKICISSITFLIDWSLCAITNSSMKVEIRFHKTSFPAFFASKIAEDVSKRIVIIGILNIYEKFFILKKAGMASRKHFRQMSTCPELEKFASVCRHGDKKWKQGNN